MERKRLAVAVHPSSGSGWCIMENPFGGYHGRLPEGKAGEEIHLPAKTTSFQEWSRKQESYARSARLEEEESYWREIEEKICRGKLEKAETGETGIGTVKVELHPEVTENCCIRPEEHTIRKSMICS